MCAKTIKWTSIVFHVIIFVLIDAETYYTKKIKGEVSGITFSVAHRPILYLFGDSITQYSSKVRPSWVSGIWSVLLISNDMLVIAASFHYFFSKLDILTSIFSSPVPYLASNRAFARVFRTTVRYHIAGGPAGLGHPAGRFVHSLLPLRGHSEPRLFRVRTPARSSYTGCRSCQPATGERLTLAVMACCALGTGGGRDGTGWQVQHAVGTDFAASGLRPPFPTPLPLLTPWFLSLRSATRMECAAL